MNTLCVNNGYAHTYGFLEPQSIQKSGNNKTQIQEYMQVWMSQSSKDIYFAPYIEGLVFNFLF